MSQSVPAIALVCAMALIGAPSTMPARDNDKEEKRVENSGRC